MNLLKNHLTQAKWLAQGELSDMAGHQLKIFKPSLNATSRLKAAMREAIRNCRLSREEIAEQMRALAKMEGLGGGRGSTITLSSLDAWVAESKPHLIPINLLPLFCDVTKDGAPIAVLAATNGLSLIGPQDRQLLEWAKAEVRSRQLARKKKRLLAEMGDFPDD